MSRGAQSFRSRIVLSTVGLMAAAMLVVGLGIQLLLNYTAQRDIDQVLHERADTVLGVIQQASTEQLTVPSDALEPGMQVYDASGTPLAGTVESHVRDVARELGVTDTERSVRASGDDDQLLGLPFSTASGDSGVLVVSQETSAYERSEFYAFLATGGLAVLVIGVTALIALRVTRQALEPVTQMAERASEWSEHDLSHRFGLGPPSNELAALGETLDHLLDRVASAIRSEQRLTSELAHELRTPLTTIQGSADLALLRGVDDPDTREDITQISVAAREMAGVISTLLDLARDGRPGGDSTCVVADLIPRLVAVADGRPIQDRTAGSSARIAAPAELVVRAVAPLVGNAVRHARTEVAIEATDHADHVELVVVDDGPGVADELRDTLFEPGVTHGTAGAGLGLGIARRVARSFGGEIALAERGDGAAFVVSLPRSYGRRPPGS